MAKPLCVVNFVSILQKCKKEKNLAYVKSIYDEICESGLEANTAVGNHLVPAFVECGGIPDALQFFNKLVQPNSCSWTYLLHGYVESGECHHALNLFGRMRALCVPPSRVTLLVLLKACTKLVSIKHGRAIHSEVVNNDFEKDLFVCNSLLDMYAKCGSLGEARKVFDGLQDRDVVSWTALIAGYADHGLNRNALICFEQMGIENVAPNAVTYLYGLKACASLGALDKGRELHTEMARDGFERDLLPASVLMDLYAKWGSTEEAHDVFKELPMQNTILWTTLIAGYSDQGLCEEALICFQQMQLAGVPADAVTFVCTLKACGNLGSLGKGLELHVHIVKEGYDNDILIGSILMDMYAKCGLLVETRKVFDELPLRDVVAWTALMAGYAYQGENDHVFFYFERMLEEGIQPNETTFLILFTVCNHAGLVSTGLKYFEVMTKKYGIAPSIKHHNCMADLLGRAGQLNEASGILDRMPLQPNVISWETVMGSCRKWGDRVLARQAYESAVRLDINHSGVMVLMSNIYADIDL